MALPVALQNLSLPVIGSPMFIASGPAMVTAQCKAGIVGSFPALNARPAELLNIWLTDIQAELAAFKEANPGAKVGPIAVNQIVHQSNDRLAHDVAVCVEHKIPIIISSLRAPPKEMMDAIHGYGGIVLHDVISIRHAKKALEAGVDGLILVAAGAGGHAGTLSPFALVGEVRKFFKGPIALSGSIAHRRRGARSAGNGRRLRVYRFALAGDQGVECRRVVSASNYRVVRSGCRLYQSVYRRARQLSEKIDCHRRTRSREFAASRQDNDELRQRQRQQGQGMARYLGRRPRRRFDGRRTERRRNGGAPES
jgi:hypothetical protein